MDRGCYAQRTERIEVDAYRQAQTCRNAGIKGAGTQSFGAEQGRGFLQSDEGKARRFRRLLF
jgi:hypothetical protein